MPEYNGWVNYETWATYSWMSSDEWSHHALTSIARSTPDPHTIAERLRDFLRELMPDLSGTLWSDLLLTAFDRIDWLEVAEAFMED